MNRGKVLTIGFFVAAVGLLVFVGISSKGTGSANINSQFGDKRKAPNFTLQDLEGKTISLADYKGRRPVILDFFATWCHNCRRDMPKLSRWYDQYKDRVEVIGVDLQEQPGIVRSYIDSAQISFPTVLDATGSVSRDYFVKFTNTHVLIGKEGSIVKFIPGGIRERDIIDLIET